MSPDRSGRARSTGIWVGLLEFLALAVLAGLVFGRYGFEGPFFLDPAVPVYAGQRLVEGVPPYVGIFDIKGPLPPFLGGLGVALAGVLGLEDLLGVRLVFFFVGCLTVSAVYLLARETFLSRAAGLLAAFTLLCSYRFGSVVAWGPDPKTPGILFGTLALVLVMRKSWLSAGVAGALAALTWQPLGALVLCALVLAVTRPGGERLRATVRTIAGAAIPHAGIGVYYLLEGASREFLNGYLLFHLLARERGQTELADHASHILDVVRSSDPVMLIPSFLGLATVAGLSLKRPFEFRYAPLLLSLPVFAALALLDFQGYADFKIFLPYAAVGFGGLLGSISVPGLDRRLCAALLALALLALALVSGTSSMNAKLRAEGDDLEDIKNATRLVEQRYGDNVRIASIGSPETLVLLGRENPTRYLFLQAGVTSWAERTYPGGLDGWLSDLGEYDPEVIAWGRTSGPRKDEVVRWLESSYHEERFGNAILFVKDKNSQNAQHGQQGFSQ